MANLRVDNHLYLLNSEKSGLPLFIIPGIGGKTDRFRMFGNIFRNVCSVYGLEMIGTQRGERPLETIEAIASQNIAWMQLVQPEGPYRLVGYSFGASIAYEMACQLEAKGEKVDFIVVLDHQIGYLSGISPHATKDEVAIGLLTLCRDYFESFRVLVQPYPDWTPQLISLLAPLDIDQMVQAIAGFLSREMPHKASTIEYVSRLINVRLFNTRITYQPQSPIYTEVIVLNAPQSREDEDDPDETLGWSGFAKNLQCVFLQGNHHSIVWGNNVTLVTRYLKQRMRAICVEQ